MSSINPSNPIGPNGPTNPDSETEFHIVVSPIPPDASRPRIEDRQPDAASADDEPFNPYATDQTQSANQEPSPDPAGWSTATASMGPGFAARFARFSVPRKKPWWFWPVAIAVLALSIVLALLAVALIIILAVPILLFVLIRAWLRGFMPLQSGRDGGGGGGAGTEAGLRQNVRVLKRRGNP